MSEVAPSRVWPTTTEDPLIVRYEDLRRQVGQSVGTGPGLALLLRQGLRSWIEAWQQTWHAPADAPRERDPASTIPAAVRADIVQLLASMVLHHQPEVRR